MNTDKPHTLLLTTWDGESYDGEDFGYWDNCEITCPYRPPAASMPCTTWEPCGCPAGRVGEIDSYEEMSAMPWPCSRSETGLHQYVEDDWEPNRPTASCFAKDWDREISHTALHLGLQAGTYLVRPWWDGDTIQLDLIDPLVATR